MPRRAQHGAAGRAGAAGAAGGGVEWLRQRVQQGTRGSGDPGAAGREHCWDVVCVVLDGRG